MGLWCSGITSDLHSEGPEFNPRRVHFLYDMRGLLLACLIYPSCCATSQKRRVSFEDDVPPFKRVTSQSFAHVEQKYDTAIRQILADEPEFLLDLQEEVNTANLAETINHLWQWNQAEFAHALRFAGDGPYDEHTLFYCQLVAAQYFTDVSTKPLARFLPKLMRKDSNYHRFVVASPVFSLQVESGPAVKTSSKVHVTPDQLLVSFQTPQGTMFIERETGHSIIIRGYLAATLIPSRRILIVADLVWLSEVPIVQIKILRTGSAAPEIIHQTSPGSIPLSRDYSKASVAFKVDDSSQNCMVMIDWQGYSGTKYLKFSVNADGTFPVEATAAEWRVDDYAYPKESEQLITFHHGSRLSLLSTRDDFVLSKLMFCLMDLVPDDWDGSHSRQRLLRVLLDRVKTESNMSDTTRQLIHHYLRGLPYKAQSIPRLVTDTVVGRNLGTDIETPELHTFMVEAVVTPIAPIVFVAVEERHSSDTQVVEGTKKNWLSSLRCTISYPWLLSKLY